MKYFAYGSNLSVNRLRQRVPSAEPLGVYRLAQHDLRFHKNGRDGSAKCDAYRTGETEDYVLGVVFDMDRIHKPRLDAAEGLGWGYRQKTVWVEDAEGNGLKAITYYAIRFDENKSPYSWYKHHVLVGAREAGLPADYVARIEAVPAVQDHDPERAAEQFAIHGLPSRPGTVMP